MLSKPIKNKVLLCAFIIVCYSACQSSKNPVEERPISKVISTPEEVKPSIPDMDLSQFRLYHTIDQIDLSGFKHFGTFFDDRLAFYFFDNPNMHIGKADIHFMMLYFMDDRLVKVRYHIDKNISNYMVDSLGMCKIKTSDASNKAILESGSVILKSKRGIRLNPALDNYELIWDRYVVESRFVVDPDLNSHYNFKSVRSNYVYIDQLKSYKRRIQELEKNLSAVNDKPS
ncbi:hypothetical protein ACFLU5_00540 [Bacteroidota bacterium]